MITGSKELIRDINSNLILETIIEQGSISRASLAKHLGLTKATVSAIVQQLIDRSLVIELGCGSAKKGRKPILLSFNYNAGYALSIDLGVETTSALLTNLKGEEILFSQHETGRFMESCSHLIFLIEEMISKLPSSPYGVIGICLGIHGVVHENEIVFTPYYELNCLHLKSSLESHFQIPIYLENEANLSVWGEKTFCFDEANIIGISIHSGIGLGVVINSKLYSGHNGYAGEFGHTIAEASGRECPCGNRGCLEQYASERALLQDFSRKKMQKSSSLSSLITAYRQNDPDGIAVIDQFITYLSIGITNIINTYNPDIIILNSSLVTELPEIIEKIYLKLSPRLRSLCKIHPSKLKDSSILLGGICICIKNFLGIKFLKFHNNSE
jgi:predicted NBD/HSP70 family sugar kinase